MFASARSTPRSSAQKVAGQAREADDRVQDDVRLRSLQQLGQVAADLRERREVVDRCRARGGGDELELVVACDDLECLAPDRAGGAQERDALHAGESRTRVTPG